jgi:hypothetical protein
VSLEAARILAGAYFVLMAIFTTWPGLVPFSRVQPLILGLPFSMAWIAGWIAGSVVVLTLLDLVEKRHRDAGEDHPVGPTRSATPERPPTGEVRPPDATGGP